MELLFLSLITSGDSGFLPFLTFKWVWLSTPKQESIILEIPSKQGFSLNSPGSTTKMWVKFVCALASRNQTHLLLGFLNSRLSLEVDILRVREREKVRFEKAEDHTLFLAIRALSPLSFDSCLRTTKQLTIEMNQVDKEEKLLQLVFLQRFVRGQISLRHFYFELYNVLSFSGIVADDDVLLLYRFLFSQVVTSSLDWRFLAAFASSTCRDMSMTKTFHFVHFSFNCYLGRLKFCCNLLKLICFSSHSFCHPSKVLVLFFGLFTSVISKVRHTGNSYNQNWVTFCCKSRSRLLRSTIWDSAQKRFSQISLTKRHKYDIHSPSDCMWSLASVSSFLDASLSSTGASISWISDRLFILHSHIMEWARVPDVSNNKDNKKTKTKPGPTR